MPDVIKSRTIKRLFVEWGGYWAPTLLFGLFFAVFGARPKASSSAPNILIVLIEHLGDVIVTAPLLRSLRVAYPDSRITAVVSKIGQPLVEHCPYLDDVVVANPAHTWLRRFMRAFSLARSLRTLNIDVAIVAKDAHNTDLNELVCILTPCKWRVSRAHPERTYRIKPLKFKPIYDKIFVSRIVRHEVESRLEIACQLTKRDFPAKLEAWLTREDSALADRFLKSFDGTGEGPIVSYGIGASAAGRRWPLESYVQVIDRMNSLVGARALLIVSPAEIHYARDVIRQSSATVRCCENATVRQSMALIQRCNLFIGNDSGPMHMAASVGVPVVEISNHPIGASLLSINSPVRFGPYGVRREILQPRALDAKCAVNGCISKDAPHCITQISPEVVVEAALRLLGH